MNLHFYVNSREITLNTAPDRRLIDILREDLALTGTKEGCGEGECGACTVLVNGLAVHSCLTLAIELQEARIETVEGLMYNGELSILQKCFVEELAIQCGFCTPGMLMSSLALIRANPNPTDKEIREALSGNVCRCSGYMQIIRAVRRAAREMGGCND